MGRTLPWNPAGHPSTTKPPTILHPTKTASPPPGTPLSRPKPAAPSARSTLVSGPVPPRSPAPSPAPSRTDCSASSPSSPSRPSEAPLLERSVSPPYYLPMYTHLNATACLAACDLWSDSRIPHPASQITYGMVPGCLGGAWPLFYHPLCVALRFPTPIPSPHALLVPSPSQR